MFKKTPYMQWQVDLDGVPFLGGGTEVTVNFHAHDIDN